MSDKLHYTNYKNLDFLTLMKKAKKEAEDKEMMDLVKHLMVEKNLGFSEGSKKQQNGQQHYNNLQHNQFANNNNTWGAQLASRDQLLRQTYLQSGYGQAQQAALRAEKELENLRSKQFAPNSPPVPNCPNPNYNNLSNIRNNNNNGYGYGLNSRGN